MKELTPFAEADIGELKALLDKVNTTPDVKSVATDLSTAINNLEGNQSVIKKLRDAYQEVANQDQIPKEFDDFVTNANETLMVCNLTFIPI